MRSPELPLLLIAILFLFLACGNESQKSFISDDEGPNIVLILGDERAISFVPLLRDAGYSAIVEPSNKNVRFGYCEQPTS